MARADRRRAQRARPAAESSRYESAYVGTDELFFQRLRRQTKWMFVFLALAFGVGFVAFGVGSEVQGGIADAIRGGGVSQSGPSVEEARDRLAKNPNSPRALRELSTALMNDGKHNEAATFLERYVQLRPRDAEALRTLAGLHLARVTRPGGLRDRAAVAQFEVMQFQTDELLAPSLVPQTTSPPTTIGVDPIRQTLQQRANERFNNLYLEVQGAYDAAKRAYEKLARVTPSDPNVQIELAQTAQEAGDAKTAIAAYERFLQLAPDDPAAPQVRAIVKALKNPTPSLPAR